MIVLRRREDERDGLLTQPRRPGIPARAALFLIWVYKALVSPHLGNICRYEPTCSAYAYEAIERYGAVRGTWLGLRRLLRCTPLHRGGYDPVP
jgi:putative membrane protein insertion efficiency factor